jgi:hypothetical protein
MSWSVEARGKKNKALNFCIEQKHFIESAPIGVQQALKTLTEYFPDNAVISIVCNGHIQGEGGNIRIEIQNIPLWIE